MEKKIYNELIVDWIQKTIIKLVEETKELRDEIKLIKEDKNKVIMILYLNFFI
jgi:hypothetical protein